MSKQCYQQASKPARLRKRLVAGRRWAASYTGKHIALDYRKHFRVTFLRACEDLQLIGVPLGPREAAKAAQALMNKETLLRRSPKGSRKRRTSRTTDDDSFIFNEGETHGIYFVVGYTSGGLPYGLTREEFEQAQLPHSGHWDEDADADADADFPED